MRGGREYCIVCFIDGPPTVQRGVPGVIMLLILVSSVDGPEIFGSQFRFSPRLFVRVEVGTLVRLGVCIYWFRSDFPTLVVSWPL